MPLPDNLPENLLSPREQIVHMERYVQDQKLGAGNFGTAYLVIDSNCPENEETKKVLKRIHVGNIEPGETTDAKREANLLSRLKHEYVVQFHDSFFDGSYFCIVTEYCDGGDMDIKLQEYKKKGEFVEETQVIAWLQQLLEALRYLHRQHILHRDLKAKNIFLKANQVKLGDFGISKILMGTTDMASTFVGTPYYMSPEVIKHDKYNDKSDIWSLGCILYEICTLKHAFDGQSLMAVMYKIVTGDIPELPQMYSPNLGNIMSQMLAREQEKRSSSKELLQHVIFKPASEKEKSSVARMTPKQRLRLKKQEEADERFRKLRELAEKTRLENDIRRRESASRNFHHTSIENSPPHDTKRPDSFNQVQHDSSMPRKPAVGDYNSVARSDKHSKYLVHDTSPTSPSLTLTPNDVVFTDIPADHAASSSNVPLDADATLNLALSYSRDGIIPDDEFLAETYYSLGNEFDDIGSSDLDDLDLEDDTMLSDSEYKAMLDQLQHFAVDGDESTVQPKQDSKLPGKPVPNSAITSNIVTSQIANMRKNCIDAMGEEIFDEAYTYLRRIWSSKLVPTAPEYNLVVQRLSDIVKDDRKCFLLEQLVYLENEAAQENPS